MERTIWRDDDGTTVTSVISLEQDGSSRHLYRVTRNGAVLAEFGTLRAVAERLAPRT
jgi:hypothetical protein